MKRAQLSIETMIIYGLVILVALSVVGGLIAFGIIDLGALLPNSCDLGAARELECSEQSLVVGGDLQLAIKNVGQNALEELSVKVTDETGIFFTSSTSEVNCEYSGSDVSGTNVLPPGESCTVLFTPSSTAKAGNVLRAQLSTNYKYKGGTLTQPAFGNLRIKAVG